MAGKNVEFHEEASAEYEAAFDWYYARSVMAASKFAEELTRAIGIVAEAPRRWPDGIHGTRKFLLRRFPFSVVYRELPSVIQVLAIAHGRRRPGYWKERL
jgi:plasmid stabilization system protein ParE